MGKDGNELVSEENGSAFVWKKLSLTSKHTIYICRSNACNENITPSMTQISKRIQSIHYTSPNVPLIKSSSIGRISQYKSNMFPDSNCSKSSQNDQRHMDLCGNDFGRSVCDIYWICPVPKLSHKEQYRFCHESHNRKNTLEPQSAHTFPAMI